MIHRLSLGPKFTLIFAMLALLGVIGYGNMVWRLRASQTDVNTINLATRQRMLIQHIAKEAAELATPGFVEERHNPTDELEAAADELERILTGLLEGDATLGLPALTDPAERAAVERVRARWLPLKAAIEQLVASTSGNPDVTTQMEATRLILTAEDELLSEVDALVTLLQRHIERRTAGVWRFGLLMGGLLLLVVVAAGVTVERHVALPLRRLARAADAMARGDLDARAELPPNLHDEVGKLTLAFNEMAENLSRSFADQAAIARENARLSERSERRARQLQALYAGSRALASTLDLEAVFQSLAQAARQLVNARYSALLAIDEKGRVTHFITDGLTPEERASIRQLPTRPGLLGVVLREGEVLRLDDLTRDPRHIGFPPGHPPMKTLLAVPIIARGKVFGNLYVTEKENGQRFTGEDEKLLTALATDAAVALENARLFQEMKARVAELQALFEVSESLTRALSLEETLQIIVDRARASIPLAESAVIHLVDQARERLVPRAVSGNVGKWRPTSGFRFGEGIAGRAIRERRMVYVPDVQRDPDFVDTGTTVRSLAVIPLIVDNEVVGTLSLASNRPNAFDSQEKEEVLGVFSVASSQRDAFGEEGLRLLASLGHQAAVAVKKAQITESLRESLAALEQRSIELENSLTQLKSIQAQLIQSEKMASIGQLAAGVAHEINNPMGFISSNLNTLAEYAADLTALIEKLTQVAVAVEAGHWEQASALAAQALEYSRQIDSAFLLQDMVQAINESREGAERVRRIVLDLRDFSREDTGEPTYADLNAALESTLNIVWNELKYKATVHREYGELPPVRCWPMRLQQVFMNLLVNAAQAIPERGEITVRTYARDEKVYVEIRDTGIGIPPEHMSRIFDPFFTTKEVGKGTGLGLSVALGIVERHGGRIEVESQVGKGSTFTVILPVHGPAQQAVESER